MASTTRALILSLKPFSQSKNPKQTNPFLSPPRHLPLKPPTVIQSNRRTTIVSVLSGGGGGLSDTRKSEFSREFAVIASMLKRIEPFDSGDISKGISENAKDSMKQTISTMLGLLPSDQFSVIVRVSKFPLHRLLVSSIITGYTLWNAEYRVSLTRNFELSLECSKVRNLSEESEDLEVGSKSKEYVGGVASAEVDVDSPTSDTLKELSPEALSYIQQLEAELCSAKQELDAQKKNSEEMDFNRGDNNNLLEYLRSLESSMVIELSQPSSIEVKEVIFELVQNTIPKVFKDDVTSQLIENTTVGKITDLSGGNEIFTISRDYLAKLLFWFVNSHLLGTWVPPYNESVRVFTRAKKFVYDVGSSLKRLGEQITLKLRRGVAVTTRGYKYRHVYSPLSHLSGNLLYSCRNCSIATCIVRMHIHDKYIYMVQQRVQF